MRKPSLPEKITAIHDGLARAKIAHAFGGALALAYYSEPRATFDIDINVFVPPSDHAALHAALADFAWVEETDAAAALRDGQSRSFWGRTPIDLFFAYDEFHDAMRAARRTVPFADGTIEVLSPEHLLVCKVLFNRPKDWLDLEAVLVAVTDLDVDEIAHWLDRIVGAEDPRAERFAGMARDC